MYDGRRSQSSVQGIFSLRKHSLRYAHAVDTASLIFLHYTLNKALRLLWAYRCTAVHINPIGTNEFDWYTLTFLCIVNPSTFTHIEAACKPYNVFCVQMSRRRVHFSIRLASHSADVCNSCVVWSSMYCISTDAKHFENNEVLQCELV